jgi:hypothetical protein
MQHFNVPPQIVVNNTGAISRFDCMSAYVYFVFEISNGKGPFEQLLYSLRVNTELNIKEIGLENMD